MSANEIKIGEKEEVRPPPAGEEARRMEQRRGVSDIGYTPLCTTDRF